MKDYSLIERIMMIFRTIASIVSWVVLILIKIVRNILPLGSEPGARGVDSGSIQS